MKKTHCISLAVVLSLVCCAALAGPFVERSAFVILKAIDEDTFLVWRSDGEHTMRIAAETDVQTASPPAPGMLILSPEEFDGEHFTPSVVYDYPLTGALTDVADGKMKLFDSASFGSIWIEASEAQDVESFVGQIVRVSVAAKEGAADYDPGAIVENDFSGIVKAVSVSALAYAEGTIIDRGEDYLILGTETGGLRAALLPNTCEEYECPVGRYIFMHYDVNEHGEAVALMLMPING